ncbi:hypothetical protein NHP20013_06290 [Helicobacter bizzozeronii]|nr:hypothetical protein NHP20013_06290 [Helicobacter bizzozeronii]
MVATTRSFERLLDANLNRLKEGVRVVEDVMRYLYDHAELALKLKKVRHNATLIFQQNNLDLCALCAGRDSQNDVLAKSDFNNSGSCLQMVQANFKRAQESARVLEECFKYLIPLSKPPGFKSLRYELYTLEKECIALIQA